MRALDDLLPLPRRRNVPRTPPAEGPAQRLAVRVSVAVAIFTFLFLQVLHHLLPDTGADFRALLRGAQDITLGRDLYSPAIAFLAHGHLRSILQMPVTLYVYPPPLAILLRPVNLLPASLALSLWDAVNVSLLAYLFVRIVRLSRAESMRELVLVSSIYGFYPLNMGLGMGQVDILLTLMGLISYLSFRHGQYGRSGVLLGCMTLIKPTLGVLLLFFLARRAWPVLVSCAVTLAGGAAISVAVVGARALWDYRMVAFGWSEQFGVLPLNQSLHGVVLRLLAPHLDAAPTGAAKLIATALEVAVFLISAVVVLRFFRGGEPRRERDGALQFYTAFSVLLLGLPFTENLHFSWMLPGIALLLVAMAKERRWRPWHAVLVIAYLVLALPIAEAICWGAKATLTGRMLSSVEAYCILAIALVFCRKCLSGRERPLVQERIRRTAAARDTAA